MSDRLNSLAELAAYDQALRRSRVALDCAIEGIIFLTSVAEAIEMLKTHITHLEEFE